MTPLSRIPTFLQLSFTILVTAALVGCTEPGGGGGDKDSAGGDASSSSSSGSDGVTTRCGAVVDGAYVNPITSSESQLVAFVAANGPNLVTVKTATAENILIRLHGLSSTAPNIEVALEQIRTFSSGGLFFVSAGSSCVENVNGGQAQIGSLFNSAGRGLAEALASTGAVKANPTDICGGDKIGICLQALEETPPAVETAGELSRFLWKPQADSDGKLAVHTAPFNTTVIVNGETGTNKGSGNGYGSLARFGRAGCAYGRAQVKVLNSRGIPFTVGGNVTFTIPSGCSRFCIEGGNGKIVSCSSN